MDGLTVGTTSFVGQPDEMSEALDSSLKFTKSGTGDWYDVSGITHEYYYEADSAQATGTQGEEACLQAIVDSPNSETVKFYCPPGDGLRQKVSSQQSHDYLQFYIDGTLKDQISGEVAWTQKSYAVSAGIHILKWRYVEGGGTPGSSCGWVDFVQWTGPAPTQDPANWQEIAYKHDVTGRRVEKKVDGYSTRYVCDGDSVIAEYDGNNNLLRKYIYGPGIDQPVSMIEVAQSNATYYYHFDALGSVVALSNASGNTVQTYQYSVYGEVAVQDPNHTNPYMFTGRSFDVEIGLYYYRARYYNPFMGRFLQTDPVGCNGGMNLYWYCRNNPLNMTDPSGRDPCWPICDMCDVGDMCDVSNWFDSDGSASSISSISSTYSVYSESGKPKEPNFYDDPFAEAKCLSLLCKRWKKSALDIVDCLKPKVVPISIAYFPCILGCVIVTKAPIPVCAAYCGLAAALISPDIQLCVAAEVLEAYSAYKAYNYCICRIKGYKPIECIQE